VVSGTRCRLEVPVKNEHRAVVDRDHSLVLGVVSVEVRRIVVVEVHRDRDAVEVADAWHRAIMSADAHGRQAQRVMGTGGSIP
jgi:hypothetical protein